MLIHSQRPDATLVAGFNKWKNSFGRHVKKGEKGIQILAPTPYKIKVEKEKLDPETKLPMIDENGDPVTEEKEVSIPMFKVVSVFDVSQTEGKPLPQLAYSLSGAVEHYEEFMEALKRTSTVPIKVEHTDKNVDGFFDLSNQSITIQAGMSEIQTVCAVIHELRAIIAGTRTHTPRKRSVLYKPAKPSGSLLIDIQAKLQEGKGAGYAKWAKSFNLKQMSQTMIYLEENGLLDLDTLNEQAAAASATYHDLSWKIKNAEQRMTEIQILQQHIVNYSKTRNVYVGYRKAGYSKKYLAEHEADILLHKAAKKYFDDQGLEKLPTYQSLQKEYAELMTQKKSMYSDYKKAQEKMRELQTAKANVDRILNMEIPESEKEKEAEQR